MYRLFYIEKVGNKKYLRLKTISTVEEADGYEVYCLTDSCGEIIVDNRKAIVYYEINTSKL